MTTTSYLVPHGAMCSPDPVEGQQRIVLHIEYVETSPNDNESSSRLLLDAQQDETEERHGTMIAETQRRQDLALAHKPTPVFETVLEVGSDSGASSRGGRIVSRHATWKLETDEVLRRNEVYVNEALAVVSLTDAILSFLERLEALARLSKSSLMSSRSRSPDIDIVAAPTPTVSRIQQNKHGAIRVTIDVVRPPPPPPPSGPPRRGALHMSPAFEEERDPRPPPHNLSIAWRAPLVSPSLSLSSSPSDVTRSHGGGQREQSLLTTTWAMFRQQYGISLVPHPTTHNDNDTHGSIELPMTATTEMFVQCRMDGDATLNALDRSERHPSPPPRSRYVPPPQPSPLPSVTASSVRASRSPPLPATYKPYHPPVPRASRKKNPTVYRCKPLGITVTDALVVLAVPAEGSPFHTGDRVVGLRIYKALPWHKVFKPTDLAAALAGVADNTNATVDVSVERQRGGEKGLSLITLKGVTLSVRMSSKDRALYHQPCAPTRSSAKTTVSKVETTRSISATWVSDTRSTSPRAAVPVRATPLRVNPTATLVPEILLFSDAESVASSPRGLDEMPPTSTRYTLPPSSVGVPPLLEDPHDVSSDNTDDLFAFDPVAAAADRTLQPTERHTTPAAEASSDDENFL